MSQLVRLEGKHTWQNAHCALEERELVIRTRSMMMTIKKMIMIKIMMQMIYYCFSEVRGIVGNRQVEHRAFNYGKSIFAVKVMTLWQWWMCNMLTILSFVADTIIVYSYFFNFCILAATANYFTETFTVPQGGYQCRYLNCQNSPERKKYI